jgi:hypothetical protein
VRGYYEKEFRMRTTYLRLNDRAQAFVDGLPDADPLKRANLLIDRANAAVDADDFELADELFEVAEGMLK